MIPQGRKEIKEAVLIATLSAIGTKIVETAFHYGKEAYDRRCKKAEEKAKSGEGEKSENADLHSEEVPVAEEDEFDDPE